MSTRKAVVLQACFLLVAIFAHAATRTMRIKVLDSETRSLAIEGSSVPKNCDAVNFDAYCNNSKGAVMMNTLLVQEGNDPPFKISCTVDTRYSRCVPLPKGQTFEARRQKRGIEVSYTDDKGKFRSQMYSLVEGNPSLAGPVENVEQLPAAEQSVKCSFSSTPAGADLTLDGKYVGSTPSVVSVTPGTHIVVVSMGGFTQWKRELTVSAGSDLTVNAVLEKAQ
ncbi:MAG: PEGA domain-containing protein [Terriglobales bacterium]